MVKKKYNTDIRLCLMILHIGDKYRLIVDVMNDCFDKNYKACYKGWYQLNKYKRTSAWFPKIADLSYGTPRPGDKNYGWFNTMSDDGNHIYMNNYENPNLLNKEQTQGIEPTITFLKLPYSDYYQYAGVFTRTRRDPKLGWVFDRIAQDIDTSEYL